MTTARIKINSIKGLALFSLFLIMGVKSCVVSAQSSRQAQDEVIKRKVKLWEDSVKKQNIRKYPTYLGGELSIAVPQYFLKSKIASLDGLQVSYLGTNLGGIMGGPLGKIKGIVGMYYSDSSVPYDMEMFQGGISGSLYLLRIKKIVYHSFEPYATLGLNRQRTLFYGNYLPQTEGGAQNYSESEQPLLAKVGYTQINVGAGVEYQIENCNSVFIHLFAEVKYGVMISSNASRHEFSGTTQSGSSFISFGINVGILK